MKKYILLTFTFLIFFSNSYAKTLSGGISYSADTAKKIAFQNIQYKIDIKPYERYFLDPNKDKNLKALAKHKYSFLDRWITYFSTTNYGVIYKENPNLDFLYDKNGNLKLIGFTQGNDFPQKNMRYDINGNLDSICLIVSKKEQFIFDEHQNLRIHWIGDNGYNLKGELVITAY